MGVIENLELQIEAVKKIAHDALARVHKLESELGSGAAKQEAPKSGQVKAKAATPAADTSSE